MRKDWSTWISGFTAKSTKNAGTQFLTGHLYNLTGLSFRVWFLSNPHQLEQHMLSVRSHDPIIEAAQAHDTARLDREISDHITNAFHTVLERMQGQDVAVAAQLGMQLLR